jgi:hypothetical protein
MLKCENVHKKDQIIYLIPSLCNLCENISKKGYIDEHLGRVYNSDALDSYKYI